MASTCRRACSSAPAQRACIASCTRRNSSRSCDTEAHWDLIVATDVYIYLPDPGGSFALTLARLAPRGWLGFSIETSAGDGVELLPQTGRYRQAPARVARELTDAGFVNITQESIVLRLESGNPVAGALFVAQRPG